MGKLNKRRLGQVAKPRQARGVLIQIAVAVVILAGVGLWQREFFLDVYVRNQLTQVGWIINGGIVLLFGAALSRLIHSFIRYDKEERALNYFLINATDRVELVKGVGGNTIIGGRYRTLRELNQRRSPINHSALAAILLASESSRSSFPRFVHNVLILAGVFGTIVSLSIALLGASEMIVTSTQIDSLGLVVHGMSTALSTTMTAILSYFFLGYFFLRLMDIQTQIISRIEHATTTILLPRFQVQQETVIEDFSDIIRAAAALIKKLDGSQAQYAETASQLNDMLAVYREEMRRHGTSLAEITDLLRDGFRLGAADE
jgi:hypothetical protein